MTAHRYLTQTQIKNRLIAERQRRRNSYIATDPPKNAPENGPLHQGAREADFETVPSDGDIIHDRNVLGLLPVIEDRTFDPVFDGFGSAFSDWRRTRTRRPAWQRQLHARRGR
jgi:hypothetical protein